jgi:hypothetical protein
LNPFPVVLKEVSGLAIPLHLLVKEIEIEIEIEIETGITTTITKRR